MNTDKEAWLSGILSFIIPGLGQVYNKRILRGILFFIGTLIGYFLFVVPGIIVWIIGIWDAFQIVRRIEKEKDASPGEPTEGPVARPRD